MLKKAVAIACLSVSLIAAPAIAGSTNESAQAVLRRGFDQLQASDYAAAAMSFRRGLMMSPKNALAHFYYGQALEELKRNTEALAQYKQSVALNGSSSVAEDAKGRIADLETKAQAAATAAAAAAEEAKKPVLSNDDDVSGNIHLDQDELNTAFHDCRRLDSTKTNSNYIKSVGVDNGMVSIAVHYNEDDDNRYAEDVIRFPVNSDSSWSYLSFRGSRITLNLNHAKLQDTFNGQPVKSYEKINMDFACGISSEERILIEEICLLLKVPISSKFLDALNKLQY